MARFGNKPVEETSALGPRPVKFTPHSSFQGNMSSVASKAAGFESSSSPKFPVLRATGSFSEKQCQAGSNLAPARPAFPKPSAVKAQFEGFHLQKEVKDSKPPFPKSNLGIKPSVNAFSAQRDEREEKAPFTKPQFGLRHITDSGDSHKDSEVRPAFQKPLPFSKLLNPVNSQEAKPVFPKPQFPKPLNSHSVTASEDKPLKPVFPKPASGLKPWNESTSLPKENTEDDGKEDSGSGSGSGRFPPRPLRPVGERGRFPSQGGEDKTWKPNEGKSEVLRPTALKSFPPKPKQEEVSALPAGLSKFLKPQNQFLIKAQSLEPEEGEKDPNAPKRRNLPAPWTLGAPPQKPNRPPTVNLDQFRQPQEKQLPVLPVSNRSANKMPPAHGPLAPNLPPRPQAGKTPDITPTTEEEEDENYDDVSCAAPPPLPPVKPEDRKIQAASDCPEEKDDSGGEMYEDLDNYRSMKELKEQEKKREKEEKKRQEQERKEQKEREKKEQEMRKKFKLSGPIEVIQNVKVTMDYRGGKNELSCKQGESLEVIRITDNPEGKWLARTLDGSYGYIKVTCVDVDYDEIKKKASARPKDSVPITHTTRQPVQDQELYDDVGANDDISMGTGSSGTGGSGFFPPRLSEEIYDDVDGTPEDIKPSSTSQDASKAGSWSWGLLKKKKVEKDEKDKDKKTREKESCEIQGESGERSLPCIPPPAEFGAEGDDVYDDVGAEDFPPPPPELSFPKSSKAPTPDKGRKDERDTKRNKKMEKEEKDFRKKFKYDGEIRILGTVEVTQNLAIKKWANRDLPVKAGEVLDIIQYTDDTKLLCRNEDGKFGYVQKVILASGNSDGDGEIYDDIDAECIYDND